jgi:EmrB/QacA subfamily drug resistance transporter
VSPARRSSWLLAFLCLCQFILIVDLTIVTVSLPVIGHDFGLSQEDLQWIVVAYGLTFGGFLIVGGRLADLVGRRRLLLAGIGLFALGSVCCAVAPGSGVLIAARALQGLGAAMASPAALALLTANFEEGHARNLALGVWATVGATGATAGNVLGGIITSTIGWRWIFLVNVPICVLIVLGALWLLPRSEGKKGIRIDLPGAVTLTAGLSLVIFALGELESKGLSAPGTFLPLCVGLALLGVFLVLQARDDDPLIPLRLFRRRSAVGYVLIVMTAMVGPGPYLLMSVYFQEVLGYSAIRTGFAFAPWAALIAISANLASRRVTKYGPRPFAIVGFVLLALAMLLLAATLATDSTFLRDILPAFVLLGVGGGITGLSCTIVATSDVPAADHGISAAVINTAQTLGSAVALSILVTIATAESKHLADMGRATADALVGGYKLGLIVSAAMAIGALILAAVAIPRRMKPDIALDVIEMATPEAPLM